MNKTIVDLFREQALKSPNSIAVTFRNEKLTYTALDNWSDQVACFLRKKGVSKETLVPVCIPRSVEMIVGILGILKAGGAYVPIDPAYPYERIDFIVTDINAKVLLASKLTAQKFQTNNGLDILELPGKETGYVAEENIQEIIKPENLANVIYTSGSTGKPKGVLVEHRNITSLVKEVDYVCLGKEDILLSTGSPSFDATTFEYWGMLLNGGCLILCPEEVLLNTKLLKEAIIKGRVTKMWFTSSWFNRLIEEDITLFKTLKTIIAGGEKLSEKHIEKIRRTYPNVQLVNGYGPTENTTFSLTYNITETNIQGSIPIGRCLNNRYAYILDEKGQKVEEGFIGELYLGGAGLARGYLNNPILTLERFIEDPFGSKAGGRLYKTGDLGRFLPDGNIEYCGRKDDQVKIRGYRVEPGEIDFAMQELELVESSCTLVIADDISYTNKLINFYIPDRNVIKSREKELYERLIVNWKELYEVEYGKTEDQEENIDAEFNLVGWNDSFTGEPFPEENMREWLDDIVKEILDLRPEKVLEIGCGTGLIYYQLAGKIKKYIGTDFSRSSINQLKRRIDRGTRNYGDTELQVCAAHEVLLKDEEVVDTIILNSIVQYFPGEDYLDKIIEKSISILKGKGRIIIGDVRDFRLLELFKGLLKINKLPSSLSLDEFKWNVELEVLREEELCFSPDYFFRLKSIYPQISNIDIKWKNASYVNELSAYRYTVVIHVGIEKEIIEPEWKSWDETDKKSIVCEFEKNNKIVAIKNVPNPRLLAERMLSKSLKDNAVNNLGELQEKLKTPDSEHIDVIQTLEVAKSKNYRLKFLLNEDPLKINLLLELEPSAGFVKNPYIQQNNASLTSVPLFNDISSLLRKEIRTALQRRLPEFMIPSDFIALKRFPLNINGKVERKLLAGTAERKQTNRKVRKLPGTEVERLIANIWQEYLDIKEISIDDNFFELGGHSLLAIRIVSAICRKLEVQLTIKDIFMHPTIEELARLIQKSKEHPISGKYYKSLISVKKGRRKVPLYIVCGGGGTVFAFKRFAELLDEDQPVFCLQQPMEPKELETFPNSLEGIAAKYVEDIVAENEEGPYALSGHCVGGVIAFEMAKQLRHLGKEVKLLAMFDTILPITRNEELATTTKILPRIISPFERKANWLYSSLHFKTFLFTKHTKEALNYTIKSLRMKINKPTNDPKRFFKQLDDIFIRAFNNYELRSSDIDILVFYAKEHYEFFDKEKNITYKKIEIDKESKNLWTLYGRYVTYYEIDGEHCTMFEPPYANEFAKLLQQHLDKCS